MTQLALPLTSLRRSWITQAKPVVVERMRGRQFCADDLHGFLPEPEHWNWFGVLVAALSSQKLIRRVGSKPSERKARNGAYVGVYEVNPPV